MSDYERKWKALQINYLIKKTFVLQCERFRNFSGFWEEQNYLIFRRISDLVHKE